MYGLVPFCLAYYLLAFQFKFLKYLILALSEGIKLFGLLLTGSMVSTRQAEMGWPDIHWLARDLEWTAGRQC